MERHARRKKIASQETDRMALITGRISAINPDNTSQDHTNGADDGSDLDEDSKPKAPPNKKDFRALSLKRREKTDNAADPPSPYKPFEYHLSSLSPKEIHFSIVSSENTRVFCSFVIAVLVVLSHINLPHNVVKSKSLIAYRPLYALLLTDVLIVAARMALFSDGKDGEGSDGGKNVNWDGAVKLLEWGLVLHQAVRAVFIDCSFYVAIVACGLSMV